MHDAAEQRNAAAMAEVRAALEASQQAEQALLKRLQLQHSQQEALEDKGVRVRTRTLTLALALALTLTLTLGAHPALLHLREPHTLRLQRAPLGPPLRARPARPAVRLHLLRRGARQVRPLARPLARLLTLTLALTLALALTLTLTLSPNQVTCGLRRRTRRSAPRWT